MTDAEKPSRSERLREEFRKYGLISAYLFVCFGVLMFYEASLGLASNSDPLSWTAALVKALVLGKFILIGDVLSVGKRADRHPLVHRVLWKCAGLLLLLIVFKLIEELVVGWIHGQTMGEVFSELKDMSWEQLLAPVALMGLILVPLVTASEIYRAVGAGQFRAILMHRKAE